MPNVAKIADDDDEIEILESKRDILKEIKRDANEKISYDINDNISARMNRI